MRTILMIITIINIAMCQSDSLKQQASNTGKLAIITVIETGNTAIMTGKELYNSQACQNGIETTKKAIKKSWNFLKAYIDSVNN